MMQAVVLLLAALIATWLVVLLAHARALAACWREPVLRYPVLILESDDWGAGPPDQAIALHRISRCLESFSDRAGHRAVMTLGIILEVPDAERIKQDDCRTYHGQRIGAPAFAPIRAAIDAGMQAGVLAPQLHGLTHYRPSTLLKLAPRDERVRAWLSGPFPALSESLPEALQSNWIDAAHLPAAQLADAEIQREVGEACAAYREVFGQPGVAVPTTFIWNERVEQAWAAHGLNTVITPGRRYTSRNASGQPDAVDAHMHNGMLSPHGLLYLVRDIYFEPARGHRAERMAAGMAAQTALGRPALVETHRFNYLGAAEDASLDGLSKALSLIMARWPQVRFLSSAELADAYRSRDPAWLDERPAMRLKTWAKRARHVPRFARLARLSGLGVVLAALGTGA